MRAFDPRHVGPLVCVGLALSSAACVLDWPLPNEGAKGGAGGAGGGVGGAPSDPCQACPEVAAFVVRDPPPVRTVNVVDATTLQNALDDATGGDVIVLQAGATYAGAFKVGRPKGDGPVVLRTSAATQLPSACARVGDTQASAFAHVVGTADKAPALLVADLARGLRFEGIEFSLQPGVAGTAPIVDVGSNAQTDPATLPADIVFRHVSIVGGGPHDGMNLGGTNITVIGSRFAGLTDPAPGSSLPTAVVVNGPGPISVIDNRLDSEGRFIEMLSTNVTPPIVPENITIAYNSGTRSADWLAKTTAVPHQFVNLESVHQAKIVGNRFEGSQDGGNGASFNLNATDLQGIDVEDNLVVGGRVGLAIPSSAPIQGFLFRNNVVSLASDEILVVSSQSTPLEVRHNTFTRPAGGTGSDVTLGNGLLTTKSGPLFLDDNVIVGAVYGVHCMPFVSVTACFDDRFQSWDFVRNLIVRPDMKDYPTAGNNFLDTVPASLFVDPGHDNYKLRDGLPFLGTSSDPPGSDPGVDSSRLDHAALCRGDAQ